MLRILLIALVLTGLVLAVTLLTRQLARARIDWTGIAFIAGFVVLAVWLRHATGMG